MISKTFTLLALTGAVTASVAGALHAQNQTSDTTRMRGMQQRGMMSMTQQCPMMGAMAEGPQSALMHRSELTLTDAQVKQLTTLRDSVQATGKTAMAQMPALRKALMQAATGDQFNERAARTALDSMAALHTNMALAMLRARSETQRVLTPEQRQQLSSMGSQGMHGRMGMRGGQNGMMGMSGGMGMMNMMGGMGMGCPMQGGGMMPDSGMMHGGMHGMPMHGADSTRTPQHEPR